MKKGHGAPDVQTVGNVGDFYEDLDTGKVYKLVAVVLKETKSQFVTTGDYVTHTNQYIWADIAGEGGGSGLPTGSKPNQYIVTDGDGNAKWEDKLCWSEEGKVVLVEPFTEEYGEEVPNRNRFPLTLEEGKNYTVKWDGVEYDCTCFVDEGNRLVVGNASLMEAGANTNEPFLVGVQDGDSFVKAQTGGDHELSIFGIGETIHKLSGKYVEGMGYVEDSLTEILPEQKIVFSLSNNGVRSAMISDSSYWSIGDNEDLKVVFDGVEYYCTSAAYRVNDNITAYIFGNLAEMGIGDDNGMPFVGGVTLQNGTPSSGSVTAFTSEESHTFGVYRVSETIHPIDKKYVMGSNLRVFITVDENDEYVASHTYEEIKNHVLSGGTCDCVMGPYIMCLTEATFMHGVQPFGAAAQATFMSIGNGYEVNSVAIEEDGPVYVRQIQLSFEDV